VREKRIDAMEQGKYLIAGKVYGDDAVELQSALGRAYADNIKPRCMCVRHGVEMYISKFRGDGDAAPSVMPVL
jgi:Protein of unknown function (DUF1173)